MTPFKLHKTDYRRYELNIILRTEWESGEDWQAGVAGNQTAASLPSSYTFFFRLPTLLKPLTPTLFRPLSCNRLFRGSF